jgi:hypothetical protein
MTFFGANKNDENSMFIHNGKNAFDPQKVEYSKKRILPAQKNLLEFRRIRENIDRWALLLLFV